MSSEWTTTKIQGRRFRTKMCWNSTTRRRNREEKKTFVFEEEEKEEDTSITECIYFPSSLVKYLIGKKGTTKNRLERETECKIRITTPDEVKVEAPNEMAFESCRTSIDVILENAKRSSSFTHFISIPLNSGDVSKNFEKWKENVLRKYVEFDASVFVLSERLHLTLFMLKLFSEKDVQIVSSILDRVVCETQHFDLKIGDLEIMNDDPSAAKVVYMNACEIKGGTKFHHCMFRLHEELERAGFVSKEDKEQQRNYLCDGTYSPKIHATVMNTKYCKRNKKKKRPLLDVRRLFQAEKNCTTTLGLARVYNLHLSKLSEFDRETKYYLSCHVAKLKTSSRSDNLCNDIDDDDDDDDDDDNDGIAADDDDRGFWTE